MAFGVGSAAETRSLYPVGVLSMLYYNQVLGLDVLLAGLVRCDWNRPLPMDRMIPKSWAVPLILEREVPCWTWAQLAETWDTMKPYFLGCPHGGRSSLFVNQETGQAIKNVWNALINTGMFGPIRTDFAVRP